MDVKEYTKLKSDLIKLQRQQDKLEGSLDTMLSRISNDYGCEDLDAAATELERLEKEEKRLVRKKQLLLNKFKDKWQEKIDEVSS